MSWLKKINNAFVLTPKDRSALLKILINATEKGILSPDIFLMIDSVIRVSDMQVRDVMVAASQMIVIEQNSPLAAILPLVLESGHSRFPVMNGQEVAGILLAKDLLVYGMGNEDTFKMEQILRPAFFVPQSKHLDILLREFRVNRNHIAMVVDEYGHVSGLVTIEDVLEEIVGEIEDEYDTDDEDEDIRQRNENSFIVKGSTPIGDFNIYFKENLRSDEFDTIGGLVLNAFGHFPCRGDSIRIGNVRFKILHCDSRRLHTLEVRHPGRPPSKPAPTPTNP